MSPCQISSILTMSVLAGGLGLLVLGISLCVNLVIAKVRGEGVEMRPVG